MAGNANLTVSVSADVTDLQAKTALARSSMVALTAELRAQANQMRTAGDTAKASMMPAYQALSAQVASATRSFNAMNAELRSQLAPARQATEEHQKMGGVLAQNRAAFQELGHSVRSVVDGLAAGIPPMNLFEMEFSRVVQALSEFKTISLATIGSWGAIGGAILGAAGALAYFGSQMAQRRDDANNLQAILKARNVDIGQDPIAGAETHLRDYGNVSQTVANQVATNFGMMRGATVESVQAMSDIVPFFAKALGTDVPDAAKKMAEVLGDVRGEGAKFLSSINASANVQNQFQASLSKMDGSAYKIVMGEIIRQTQSYIDSRKSALAVTNTPFVPASASPSNRAARVNVTSYTQGSIDTQSQQMAEAAQAAMDKLSKTPNTVGLEQFREQIAKVTSVIGGNETAAQKDEVALRLWTSAVNSGKLVGEELTQAKKEQADAQARVTEAGSREEMEVVQTNALRAAAQAGAQRTSELAAQKAVLQEALTDEKLTADQKLELRHQLQQLEVRDVRATASQTKKTTEEAFREYVAGAEEKIAADKGAYVEQVKVIDAWETHAAQVYGRNSTQYLEAVRKKIEVDNEWAKNIQAQEEKAANIAKNMQEAQANLSRIGEKPDVGEFKAGIGDIFDRSDLDAKVAASVAKLQSALNEDLAGLKGKIQLDVQAGDGEAATGAYKQATQDLLTYTNQVEQLNERAAQAVSQAWQKITQPVGQAFDSILQAAINSHGKISVAIERALGNILISYIKMAVKAVTNWAAMELQKTFLTQSGEAARQAAQAPAEAAQVAQLAQMLGKFVATEAAKTGAVVTGTAIRTTVQQTGQASGQAIQAAAASKSIMTAAGQAAANTYAATSSIPVIGPILAPAAAAVAFGAVAAYTAVASAEGGWDQVPYDGAPAILHKNEMVLPANLAEGVRRMTAAGLNLPTTANARLSGTSSVINNSGDVNHSVTINHNPTINNAGPNEDGGATSRALRQANAHLYRTAQAWYGKGSMKLPGR